MNRRGPKVKLARQLGIALTPKAARVMERRPNPPGQHGASPRRKVSGYKKQLVEKQRLRAQYNVSERQLQNAFAQAIRQTGNTVFGCCSCSSSGWTPWCCGPASSGPSTRHGRRSPTVTSP